MQKNPSMGEGVSIFSGTEHSYFMLLFKGGYYPWQVDYSDSKYRTGTTITGKNPRFPNLVNVWYK